MKRLIGFIAFWIAVGMLLMLFLAPHYLIALIIIVLLLLVGYNFCLWRKTARLKLKRAAIASSYENYALSTLPVFKQLVQTCILLEAPFTMHLTLLMLECQILLDLLWEWLTLFPKWTPLPQISHLAIITPPDNSDYRYTQRLYITRKLCIWQAENSSNSAIFRKNYCFFFFALRL